MYHLSYSSATKSIPEIMITKHTILTETKNKDPKYKAPRICFSFPLMKGGNSLASPLKVRYPFNIIEGTNACARRKCIPPKIIVKTNRNNHKMVLPSEFHNSVVIKAGSCNLYSTSTIYIFTFPLESPDVAQRSSTQQ